MAHRLEPRRLISTPPDVCRPSRPKQRSHIRIIALGEELAAAGRQLVYGGGSKGIMGIVSGAALAAGGDVVGVTPHAMLSVGGEGEQVSQDGSTPLFIKLGEEGREKVGVTGLHSTPITDLSLRWVGYE